MHLKNFSFFLFLFVRLSNGLEQKKVRNRSLRPGSSFLSSIAILLPRCNTFCRSIEIGVRRVLYGEVFPADAKGGNDKAPDEKKVAPTRYAGHADGAPGEFLRPSD